MRVIRPTGEVLTEINDAPDSVTIRELKADLVDIVGAPAKTLKVQEYGLDDCADTHYSH